MGRKGPAEQLTQQIDEVRDRVADSVATHEPSGGTTWPRRLLWVGFGVGIGAAAAGGRLLRMLPAQLATRLEGVVRQAGSVASDLTGKVGGAGVGDTSELSEGATSAVDETIDVTDAVTTE
jgi:hypothetical protein